MRGRWVCIAGAWMLACGGSVESTGSEAGSGAGGAGATPARDGGSPSEVHHGPPLEPSAAPGPSGPALTLAIDRVFFGDTDRVGNPSREAWREYGYDIDGIVSETDSTNHCASPRGAPRDVIEDGAEGIDNSFGRNIVPLILSLGAEFSVVLNRQLALGRDNGLLHFPSFGPEPDQSFVDGWWLEGAPFAGEPRWDGSDLWPIRFESTTDGQRDAPLARYRNGYLAGGVWVGSPVSGPVRIPLAISEEGIVAPLTLTHVIVTARIEGTGRDARAIDGVISGILQTEPWVAEMRDVAFQFDQSLCTFGTFESIAMQLRAASDIMADGSNGPGLACNGISVGLGFTASAAQLGSVVDPESPPPEPCAP